MSAVDPHEEAHRLKRDLGYGARRIAEQLGITRHAATQLLAQPLPQPPAVPVAGVADEVAAVAQPVAEPAAPVADLVAGQVAALAGHRPPGGRRVVVDLDEFPGLAEDLALLEETGASAGQVVNFAVERLASAYRTARDRGWLRRGQAFDVTDIWLKPGVLRRAA
ncbi:hypothetical protein ACQEV4_42610 [Streptomyces shenzhenensis]|uniref:hypothetical protein n=1 Tax=Streptomyces shenzhenensis TaxID=943815 RepID=UPI003D8C510B